MIVEYGGGKGGLKEYLESGRKVGRAQSRDELDERRVLVGDLEVAERLYSEFETEGNRYRHFTLSFAEGDLDDSLMRTITQEFAEYVYAGYSPDEYYIYAERHVPRIKSVINEETESSTMQLGMK